MRSVYHLTVTAHVLAAVTWLGGMIAFASLAPILRRVGDDADRQLLFHELGGRFRTVGWICIAVLLGTGVGQLHMRGWWGAAEAGALRRKAALLARLNAFVAVVLVWFAVRLPRSG